VIETERLWIRPPSEDERAELLALWRDPANARVEGEASDGQLRAWVAAVPCAVWERESGELVGDCSLHFDTGFGAWELSYGIRRDRWGRGYATEAARACVRHGLGVLGIERIVADVDPANAASRRVLEKSGFAFAGVLADGRLLFATGSATRR
jgi:RimJ/RimL family protein N-acetyltransferase